MKRNPNPTTPIINPKTLPNLSRIPKAVKNAVCITGAKNAITTQKQNRIGKNTSGFPQSISKIFIVQGGLHFQRNSL